MSGINEVKLARFKDDLMTSQSTENVEIFPIFETLDARIASAVRKIIFNTSCKRRASVGATSLKTKSILERKMGKLADWKTTGVSF